MSIIEAHLVVKEHVWEHGDGERPTLAYLLPSEFGRKLHGSFAEASAFIREHELPLGWVAMKMQLPEQTAAEELRVLKESLAELATKLEVFQPNSIMGPLHGAGMCFAYEDTAKAIRILIK